MLTLLFNLASALKLAGVTLRASDASASAQFYGRLGLATAIHDTEAVVSFKDGFRLGFAEGASCEPFREHFGPSKVKGFGQRITGLLGVGIEGNQELLDTAVDLGAEVQDMTLCASLVPDEPAEKETPLKFGYVPAPDGIPVCVVLGRDEPAAKLMLAVVDLDRSTTFYREVFGMTLARKRALLPDYAAMSCFMSFTDADEATLIKAPEGTDPDGLARIELRYIYNTDEVLPNLGIADILMECDDPSSIRDRALTHGGTVVDDFQIKDPDGYVISLVTPS